MRRLLAPVMLLLALALAAGASASASASVYKGKLVVRHTDDFRHGLGQTTWTLRTRHGKRLPLRPDKAPLARSGTAVTVKGHRVGPWLEGKVRRRGGAQLRSATALGTHRVAVILINFATDTRTPWTPAQVAQRVFTDPDSTAAFYDEESYGGIKLTGDVLGWYTVSGPTDGCDVDAWASQARAAAAAAGKDLTLYDHVAYVFPQQSSCNWAGLGEMPGSQTWMNGTTAVRVVAHELGHNMGLHHASSYSCTSGGVSVTLSSSCSASEYGDPFDVMGLNARHNSAWHLSRLGVLSGSDVQVVNASGTYTVRSAIADGSGAALLRIPAGGTPPRYYDVSLRQAGGVFDNYLSSDPVVNGVSVHYDVAGASRTQSLLLDNTPGSTGGFGDSPLAQGRIFTAGDVSITATSVAPGLATVDVVMGATADTEAPSAPSGLYANASGTTVALGWSPASDNVAVTGYRVYRDYALAATVPAPGFADAGRAAGTAYRYQVAAYDAAGNSTLSSPVYVTVPSGDTTPPPPPPPPPADTRAPVVKIASPGRDAKLKRSATIVANATDDTGVQSLELSIDAEKVVIVPGSKLRRTWSLRGVTPGRHVIQVRAFDAAGNIGSRYVRVRVVAARAARSKTRR
jgi:hypothetical protein